MDAKYLEVINQWLAWMSSYFSADEHTIEITGDNSFTVTVRYNETIIFQAKFVIKKWYIDNERTVEGWDIVTDLHQSTVKMNTLYTRIIRIAELRDLLDAVIVTP